MKMCVFCWFFYLFIYKNLINAEAAVGFLGQAAQCSDFTYLLFYFSKHPIY